MCGAALSKEAPYGPACEDEDMKRMMWVVEQPAGCDVGCYS